MKLSDQAAYNLVKAGIESNSIKLNGTEKTNAVKHATEAAEADAAYIKKLLSLLTQKEPSTEQ